MSNLHNKPKSYPKLKVTLSFLKKKNRIKKKSELSESNSDLMFKVERFLFLFYYYLLQMTSTFSWFFDHEQIKTSSNSIQCTKKQCENV